MSIVYTMLPLLSSVNNKDVNTACGQRSIQGTRAWNRQPVVAAALSGDRVLRARLFLALSGLAHFRIPRDW